MSYQKIQAKGAYSDFTIGAHEIDPSIDPLQGEINGSWLLCLVNTTSHDLELASLCYDGQNYGPWFRIPVVKNNCPTGYDECFDQQKWSIILALPKDSERFSIRIATKPNAFGSATGTEFLEIQPAAEFRGGIIGVAADG